MIGGTDISIETHAGDCALDCCARAVLQMWPGAVFEDGETGERFARFDDLALAGVSELLVYRDAAVASRWDDEGAVPELADTMVHLIADPGCLTVVVDDPEAEPMRRLLDTLRTGLQMDVPCLPLGDPPVR